MTSVNKIAEAGFPTRWGDFRILGFEGQPQAGGEVEGLVALVMGDIHSAPPLVRIHSQCMTGDVFGSLRCDCRLQLELALGKISEAGAGILGSVLKKHLEELKATPIDALVAARQQKFRNIAQFYTEGNS